MTLEEFKKNAQEIEVSQLFDFLEEHMREDGGCNHDLQLTSDFLSNNNVAIEPVLSFLREHGGYCDCKGRSFFWRSVFKARGYAIPTQLPVRTP